MTSETEEPCYIQCPKCKAVIEEGKVKEAQELMRSLPAAFDPQCPEEVVSFEINYQKCFFFTVNNQVLGAATERGFLSKF